MMRVFESVGSFQKALQIGPMEAKASMNLLKEVDKEVGDRLMQLCRFGKPVGPVVVGSLQCFFLACYHWMLDVTRRWGQARFLSHEPISNGLFNESFNGGHGALQAWEPCMLNRLEVVQLMVDRLASDYEQLSPKMRRPYGSRDIETLMCDQVLLDNKIF